MASLLVGGINIAPEFPQFPIAILMVELFLAAIVIAVFLRVLTRPERVFWREKACGIRPMPYFFAVMTTDLLLVTSLAFVSSGLLYASFAPLMQFRIFAVMIWAFFFSISGQAYMVSSIVDSHKTTITGVGLVAAQINLSGTAPTLPELNETPGFGPLLAALSQARWFSEGLMVAERNSLADVSLLSADSLLDLHGWQRTPFVCASVLFAFGLLFRLLAVLIFMFFRRSQL